MHSRRLTDQGEAKALDQELKSHLQNKEIRELIRGVTIGDWLVLSQGHPEGHPFVLYQCLSNCSVPQKHPAGEFKRTLGPVLGRSDSVDSGWHPRI